LENKEETKFTAPARGKDPAHPTQRVREESQKSCLTREENELGGGKGQQEILGNKEPNKKITKIGIEPTSR